MVVKRLLQINTYRWHLNIYNVNKMFTDHFFLRFTYLNFVCISVCLHIYMFTMYMPGVFKDWKRKLNPHRIKL